MHIHLVPVVVLLLEESLDLVEAVPVDGLDVLRGEPHGDDALVDVGEIEVEAIVDVAPLLLRDDRLECRCHPRQIRPEEKGSCRSAIRWIHGHTGHILTQLTRELEEGERSCMYSKPAEKIT